MCCPLFLIENSLKLFHILSISDCIRGLLKNTGANNEKLRSSVETSSELVMKTTYIGTRTKTLKLMKNSLMEISGQSQMLSVGVGMARNSMAQQSGELNGMLHHFKF